MPNQPSGKDRLEYVQPTPLSRIRPGRKVTLVRVNAGRGLNSRLAALGLVPNVQLFVVNNGHPGPFVVAVKESRIMLGRGMADKILVK